MDEVVARSLLKVALLRFSEISVDEYPGLILLLGRTRDSNHAPSLMRRLLEKALSCERTAVAIKSDSRALSVLGKLLEKQASDLPRASRKRCIGLVDEAFVDLSVSDPDCLKLSVNILEYLAAGSKYTSGRMRLMRDMKSRLVRHLRVEQFSGVPKFSLFVQADAVDPSLVLDLVTRYLSVLSKIERRSPVRKFSEFRRSVAGFLSKHVMDLDRGSVLSLLCSCVRLGWPVAEAEVNLLHRLLRGTKNLSALPLDEMKRLTELASAGLIRSRFHYKRLVSAAKDHDILLPSPVIKYPQPILMGMMRGSRPHRRRAHAWLRMHSPLRAKAGDLEEYAKAAEDLHVCACSVCEDFRAKLLLARQFHSP